MLMMLRDNPYSKAPSLDAKDVFLEVKEHSLLVLCMAWLQAKSQAKPSHTGQAKPSQMSWPEVGFGLALEFKSQSQASKPWLWMSI